MPQRKLPENDHDALMQLWHAILGINGGGLIEQMKKQEKAFDNYVVHREETCFFKIHQTKIERRKLRKTDVILGCGLLIVSIAGGIMTFIAGHTEGWW